MEDQVDGGGTGTGPHRTSSGSGNTPPVSPAQGNRCCSFSEIQALISRRGGGGGGATVGRTGTQLNGSYTWS